MKQSQSSVGKPRGGGVRAGHKDYAALNRATEQRIQWPTIMSCSGWKWRENVRSFSLYTAEHPSPTRGFCVLATGLVKGSLREIAAVLEASTQHEFENQMVAFHGKTFKHGRIIPDVRAHDTLAQDERTDARDQLSIRCATFGGRGLLRHRQSWCFLDSSKYHQDGKQLEKYMTALPLENARMGDARRDLVDETNCMANVICGFRVRAEEASAAGEPITARVHIYAEHVPQTSSLSASAFAGLSRKKRTASIGTVERRMVHFIQSCERISQVVRRRRLGVQVLMDPRRASPLANPHCINCEKVLIFAKLCRLCGNAVCKECSDKYERETRRPHVRTAVHIDRVRVCDPCLTRVENADYSNITTGSLSAPAVFPDLVASKSAGGDLRELLQDALVRAPSPQRQDAVRSVIRCVLDQEGDSQHERQRTKSSFSSTMSSTTSLDQDCRSALDNLRLDSIAYTDARISGQHGRSYVLNPYDVTGFPVPENDDDRVRSLEALHMFDRSDWDELTIICEIAAREVGASTSVVTVITKDEQRILASNLPSFLTMHTGRGNAFCAHTVMESDPLIVRHPEADFRMSHIAKNWNMGFTFYCGFPLMTKDNTPFGTLCCVDEQTHELTASQYTAMVRLAETASKIIRLKAGKTRAAPNL